MPCCKMATYQVWMKTFNHLQEFFCCCSYCENENWQMETSGTYRQHSRCVRCPFQHSGCHCGNETGSETACPHPKVFVIAVTLHPGLTQLSLLQHR